MPILLLALGGVASFFTGAYVGTVVDNANQAPQVQINSDSTSVSENKGLSNSDLVKAGGLGVLAWFIYKKFLK